MTRVQRECASSHNLEHKYFLSVPSWALRGEGSTHRKQCNHPGTLKHEGKGGERLRTEAQGLPPFEGKKRSSELPEAWCEGGGDEAVLGEGNGQQQGLVVHNRRRENSW